MPNSSQQESPLIQAIPRQRQRRRGGAAEADSGGNGNFNAEDEVGRHLRRLRTERGLPPDKNVSALQRQLNLVNVELPLPISLPADYVADKETRLGLYRRLANVASHAEIETLAEEFDDRFGPPPEEVLNLLFQLQIKLLAESAGLAQISYEGRQMVFRFPAGSPPENLPDLGSAVRVGRTALWLPYENLENWRAELQSILEKMQAARLGAKTA